MPLCVVPWTYQCTVVRTMLAADVWYHRHCSLSLISHIHFISTQWQVLWSEQVTMQAFFYRASYERSLESVALNCESDTRTCSQWRQVRNYGQTRWGPPEQGVSFVVRTSYRCFSSEEALHGLFAFLYGNILKLNFKRKTLTVANQMAKKATLHGPHACKSDWWRHQPWTSPALHRSDMYIECLEEYCEYSALVIMEG